MDVLRWMIQGFMPMIVPGGRVIVSSVVVDEESGSVRPVAGTTRSTMWPSTGWMRRASWMQAVR
jgi:hypothetical protein